MKVIEKTMLPDGTPIQLEDWSEHNSAEYPDLYGYTIGAYPIAKNTGRYSIIRGGERFRLSISNNSYAGYTNENVKADYAALISGEKTLKDLSGHFWNGKKDMYHLGMDVLYQEAF
jgi:hypothetical protein